MAGYAVNSWRRRWYKALCYRIELGLLSSRCCDYLLALAKLRSNKYTCELF